MRALYDGKGFVWCDTFGCDHSSRMPGLPYFLYALSPLTTSLRAAAFIKALLLSLLVYMTCRGLPERLFYSAVACFVVFAPNLVKHAASAHYEEGYTLELLAITVVATLSLPIAPPKTRAWPRYFVPIAAVSIVYLFKSSMIPVWLSVSSIIAYLAFALARRWLALALVGVALLAPSAWLIHNFATGGRFSVMSSYDGENMFRGWNARTLDIYPRCSLDVLFKPIGVCDGEPIDIVKEEGRDAFKTEWAWNDAYKTRAMDWITQHPAAAFKTLEVKAMTVLGSLRLTPYRSTDGVSEKPRSAFEERIGDTRLAFGRGLELLGLLACLFLLIRGDRRARLVTAASIAMVASYATPYILGFGYERHFSLFIMMTAICDLFLISEILRLAEPLEYRSVHKTTPTFARDALGSHRTQ